jgi:hypothetical protein
MIVRERIALLDDGPPARGEAQDRPERSLELHIRKPGKIDDMKSAMLFEGL